MTNTEPNRTNTLKDKLSKWGIFAGALLIAFLLGLIPMWLSVRSCEAEHEITKTQLRKSEVSGLLSTSIVEARRGEYEPARQAASDFFTRLRAEADKSEGSFLTADQRPKLNPIFDNRDAAITMLAQRDPAALDRLTDIFNSYKQVVSPKSGSTEPAPANVPTR